MQYFPTSATRETNDYPYGRLKCTAVFGTEFKAGRGFRSTFQTQNPKTGKWNKPKLGTYYTMAVLRQDEETGRITHTCIANPSGRERMTAALGMLSKHWHLFTDEERKYIAQQLHMHVAVDCRGTILYGGADRDQCIALFKPALDTVKQMMQTGLYFEVVIDWDAVEALKPENYNPFVTTTTQIIG